MAKRSRRARRQANKSNKATNPVVDSGPAASNKTTIGEFPAPVSVPTPTKTPQAEAKTGRKATANFRQEYFYVYQELRTIFAVAILMFIVLVALSFVI